MYINVRFSVEHYVFLHHQIQKLVICGWTHVRTMHSMHVTLLLYTQARNEDDLGLHTRVCLHSILCCKSLITVHMQVLSFIATAQAWVCHTVLPLQPPMWHLPACTPPGGRPILMITLVSCIALRNTSISLPCSQSRRLRSCSRFYSCANML